MNDKIANDENLHRCWDLLTEALATIKIDERRIAVLDAKALLIRASDLYVAALRQDQGDKEANAAISRFGKFLDGEPGR